MFSHHSDYSAKANVDTESSSVHKSTIKSEIGNDRQDNETTPNINSTQLMYNAWIANEGHQQQQQQQQTRQLQHGSSSPMLLSYGNDYWNGNQSNSGPMVLASSHHQQQQQQQQQQAQQQTHFIQQSQMIVSNGGSNNSSASSIPNSPTTPTTVVSSSGPLSEVAASLFATKHGLGMPYYFSQCVLILPPTKPIIFLNSRIDRPTWLTIS